MSDLKPCPWCGEKPFIYGAFGAFMAEHDCKEIGISIDVARDEWNSLSPWYDVKVVMPTSYCGLKNFEFKSHGGRVIEKKMMTKDWEEIQLIPELFSHWRPIEDK